MGRRLLAFGRLRRGAMTEIVEDYLYASRHYYFGSEVHGIHYGEFANYADQVARSLIEGWEASPGLEEGVETYCVIEAMKHSADGAGRAVVWGRCWGRLGWCSCSSTAGEIGAPGHSLIPNPVKPN